MGDHWLRCRIAVLAGLAAALALRAPAARADTGCEPAVAITERLALATVTVTTPCRDSGQPVEVIYDDSLFLGRFGADGQAKVAFVLTRPTGNEIVVVTGEGARLRRSIDAPDFDRVYRITMLWQSPVRLRLHVVEPGQRLGQIGDVSDAADPADVSRTLGTVDLAWSAPALTASGEETAAEQSYVLADPRDRARGVFTPYFEYPTRGPVPAPPFCGNGRLASVAYRLFVIDEGRIAVDVQHESPRAACGQTLAPLQQRIRGLQ